MTRTRRPSARGTRRSSGIESGVTWASNPSGVTIGTAGLETVSGLITPTELNYINGSAGYSIGNTAAGKLVTSGVTYYTGTTKTIFTGLSTITALNTCVINEGAGSQPFTVKLSSVNTPAGQASAQLRYSLGSGGGTVPSLAQAPGVSIAWIAFGT